METLAALSVEKRRVSCVLGEVGSSRSLPKIISSVIVEQPSVSPPSQIDALPPVPMKIVELSLTRRMRWLRFMADPDQEWMIDASLAALREAGTLASEAPKHVLLGSRPPYPVELSAALSREGYELMGFESSFEMLGRSLFAHNDNKRANLFVRCGESSIEATVFLLGWPAWSAHYPGGSGELVREVAEHLDEDVPEAWAALQDAVSGLASSCSDATTRAESRVTLNGNGAQREIQKLVLDRLSKWSVAINDDLRAHGPYEQLRNRPVLVPSSRFVPQGLSHVFARLLNRRLELRRLFPRRQYKPSEYLDCRLNGALGVFLQGVR